MTPVRTIVFPQLFYSRRLHATEVNNNTQSMQENRETKVSPEDTGEGLGLGLHFGSMFN